MNFSGYSEQTHSKLKYLTVGMIAMALVAAILPPVAAIGLIVGTLFLALVSLNEHADWSMGHPFAFMSLVLMMSTVGPLFDYLILDSREASWALLDQTRQILVPGGILVLSGIAVLIYGYSISWGGRAARAVPEMPTMWDRGRAVTVAKAFVGLGLVAFVYILISIELSDISAKRRFSTVYIRWIVQFLFFGGLVGLVTVLHHDEPLLSRLGVGSTGAIGLYYSFGFLVSSRSQILWNTILVLAVYVQYRRVKAAPLFGVGAVSVLLASAMLGLRSNASTLSGYFSPLPALHSVFGADRGGITSISHIIRITPQEMPYRYGETLIQWVVFPIPRAIWSDKPTVIGQQIARNVYGAGNGTPPGMIGDLYWNFWIIGVLVGLFIVGILLRSLVAYRSANSESTAAILATTVLLFHLSRLIDATGLMTTIGMWMVPITIAIAASTDTNATESKLTAGWKESKTQSVFLSAKNTWKRACSSSYAVTLIKKLDQTPNE